MDTFLEVSPFLASAVIFILAIFLGFSLVWRVTPALHSPLMAVTNAVSSVVIVGGILSATLGMSEGVSWLGILAVFLCMVNIVGGFVITHRMLGMFQKSQKKDTARGKGR